MINNGKQRYSSIFAKIFNMDQLHLSEQELIRREALDELIKLGINPFPAETFDINVSTGRYSKFQARQRNVTRM
jgi:hypothetical protein